MNEDQIEGRCTSGAWPVVACIAGASQARQRKEPVRPMVNSLKTRVHALYIILDEIYCYVTFFEKEVIYSLVGWLIR